MKKIGIMSCNIYCNFTNYGSALQSWALQKAINKVEEGQFQAILVDYCPDDMIGKDFLNPLQYMWDTDPVSKQMCELSLPAIKTNYNKFDAFYNNQFIKTKEQYTSDNFNEIVNDMAIDGFVCGSDTIFCVDEFGFDEGYYSNFKCMKEGYSFSYAASFGDTHFNDEIYRELNKRIMNFNAISLRESGMIAYVKEHTNVPVQKVIDPTLLLTVEEYDEIVAPRQERKKYLLLYARRYNAEMEKFAEQMALENGWEVVEISLRAVNAKKHRMFYEAGVEEFLSLVKHAEFVVTNSFHGIIFSVQYRKQFAAFSRDQCDTKIIELLNMFGLSDRLLVHSNQYKKYEIDYVSVHERIEKERVESLRFLENRLLDMSSYKKNLSMGGE